MRDIGSTRTDPFEKIERLISRISYKPNVRLRCLNVSDADSIEIMLAAQVPDSTAATTTIEITVVSILRLAPVFIAACGDHELIQMIRNHIRKWEEHELDEFFKVDGIAIFDPHSDQKKT